MHVCSSDQIRGQAWMNETKNHSFESRQQKYLGKTVWADSKFLEPFRSIFISHRHEISSLDAKVKQIRLIFANPRRWWELGGPSEPYRRHQGQGRVWGRRLHLSVWEREKNAASETFGYNLIIFYFWKCIWIGFDSEHIWAKFTSFFLFFIAWAGRTTQKKILKFKFSFPFNLCYPSDAKHFYGRVKNSHKFVSPTPTGPQKKKKLKPLWAWPETLGLWRFLLYWGYARVGKKLDMA